MLAILDFCALLLIQSCVLVHVKCSDRFYTDLWSKTMPLVRTRLYGAFTRVHGKITLATMTIRRVD